MGTADITLVPPSRISGRGAEVIQLAPSTSSRTTAPAPSMLADVQRKHVVVLDDDESLLRAVLRHLEASGFRVTATTRARDAMAAVVSGGADAIVCDLHMPGVDGHVVLTMLARAAPSCARVLLTNDDVFGRSASVSVPHLDAFVSKREVTTRLVPTLRALCHETPDTESLEIAEESRALARHIVRALTSASGEIEALRLAAWSRRLARELGLSESRCLDVELGALLHDVGTVGIREALLLKAGPLAAEEWAEIRRHPDLGVAFLSDIPPLRRAIPVVQCHHERRDGKGYPRGLTGNAIPLEARIFQLVDAYDALTSDRPHRAARSDAEARTELARNVGPQFDPEVFAAFESISHKEWARVVADII